jgi:hypothetical protein
MQLPRWIIAAAAFGLLGPAVSPAAAQEFSSRYSSTAVKKCKLVDRAPKDEGNWSVWQCAGVGGYVVRITEDDLRHNVSVGRTFKEAEDAAVAKHQFPGFNAIGDTLEWRLFQGRPFAIIHRWTLFDAGDPARKPVPYSMMVVTRLNPTCHAAYIDVRANAPANANTLARQAADTHGTIFDCNNKPIVVGKRGRAIELSTP